VAATLASPLVLIVAVAGRRDLPDSALEPRTFLIGALIGAVATVGLVWALDGPVRRVLIVVQGAVGFSLAGVLLVAHREEAFVPVAVAGAVVGAAFGLGAPAGVPLGAFVGAATFSLVGALGSAGALHPALGFVGAFVGIAAWGAAMGLTTGWCEESAGRGHSWAAAFRPAGVLVALAVLVPAQVAAAVVASGWDPPALCFDVRPRPAGNILGAADLDGDGDSDVLQVASTGTLTVLRNDGGVLSAQPDVPGIRTGQATLGDADADGDLDVAAIVVQPRQQYFVVVARNDGRGTFTAGPAVALDVDQPRGIAMADLDGDGAADLIVPGKDGPVVLWSRAGRLERGPRLPAWPEMTMGDVDGDGRTDVVSYAGYGGVEVHRMSGQAQYRSARVPFPDYVTHVALSDVDGDGDADLVVGAIREIVLMANDGAGNFSPLHTLPGGRDNAPLTAADLDGDGDVDLAASDGRWSDERDAGVWAWENKGAGRWSEAGHIGRTLDDLVAADITGDGRADLLAGGKSRFSSGLLVSRPC
jgi:hypothetical protein